MDRKIIFVFSLFLALSLTIGEVQAQIISTPKKAKATVSAKNKNTAKTSSTATLKLNGNEDDFSISIEQCGGLVEMNVITNASTYTIDQMPSFCKLQSQMGSTFTITCDSNNTNQNRTGILSVSIPEGKQIVTTIHQKGIETSFLCTLYEITLGETTYGEMESKGFKNKTYYIGHNNWKGLHMACYSKNDYRNKSLPRTITHVKVIWHGKKTFPEEWIRAGAPSGEINYYQWKVFLQNTGFTINDTVEGTDYVNNIIYAENKKFGINIEVESESYRRNNSPGPNPSLPSSDVGIKSFSIKYKHW